MYLAADNYRSGSDLGQGIVTVQRLKKIRVIYHSIIFVSTACGPGRGHILAPSPLNPQVQIQAAVLLINTTSMTQSILQVDLDYPLRAILRVLLSSLYLPLTLCKWHERILSPMERQDFLICVCR